MPARIVSASTGSARASTSTSSVSASAANTDRGAVRTRGTRRHHSRVAASPASARRAAWRSACSTGLTRGRSLTPRGYASAAPGVQACSSPAEPCSYLARSLVECRRGRSVLTRRRSRSTGPTARRGTHRSSQARSAASTRCSSSTPARRCTSSRRSSSTSSGSTSRRARRASTTAARRCRAGRSPTSRSRSATRSSRSATSCRSRRPRRFPPRGIGGILSPQHLHPTAVVVIDLAADELLLVEGDDDEVAAWLAERSPTLETLSLARDPAFTSVVVPAAVRPFAEMPTLLNTGGKRTEFSSAAVPGLGDGSLERLGGGVSDADVIGSSGGAQVRRGRRPRRPGRAACGARDDARSAGHGGGRRPARHGARVRGRSQPSRDLADPRASHVGFTRVPPREILRRWGS